MPPSFIHLPEILNNPVHYLFHTKQEPLPGKLQYCGPHFLVVISYAIKLASNYTPTTFTDGLTSLEAAATSLEAAATRLNNSECGCWCFQSSSKTQKFLSLLASFLAEIREFFVVPKLQQYPSNITSHSVAIIASFIDFLVNHFEILSRPTHSWIIIPGQINMLCKRFKLLLAILLDTPFQCARKEGRKNILAEIESIANEAGTFLYSFFFTTDHVTMMTMDLELSLLLSKLDAVEEMIKQHCIIVFERQKPTTPNLTSSSIFIVDSLLDDLNHILNHNADLIIEAKDQITTLHEGLYLSRSVLKNIELQHNKELIECELQLINLAYQAEPVVACLVAREVPVWYISIRLPIIIEKSKHIEAKLANIKPNSSIRGLQVAESFNKVSSPQLAIKSIPMVDEIIVGFKETTRQIVSQLIGGPDPLQIISVVGMGGLGKTTIARKLFNDSNVLLRFDKRSWCVVSQTYQRRNLLIDVLSYVSPRNKDEILEMEDHQLIDHLHKCLKGTRYLLVMDDIWKIEAWDDLRRYFPNDRNGSRILFTTRNKDVALHASSKPFIHDLPLLTDDHCWDLLQTKVFPNSSCPLELQDVGKKIAKNCKGLPLAVVGIGGVLATMEKKEGLWQEVATRLSSYISNDRDILELSYKHLPSHLKPCFLSLGTFKEDEAIHVRRLFSLWISQGYIPTIEDRSPHDVAECYLLELINRSMVQLAKTRSDKGVKTCTIHDLMRDMSLRLADKENFLKVINMEFSIYEQHHHIHIHSSSNYFNSLPFGPHVRSLSGNVQDLSSITSSMIRLKVLKLSNPNVEYDGTSLALLVQLRHLECDGKLRNFGSHMKLEFLRLGGSVDMNIQLNMPNLKHLQFRKYQRIPEAWYNSLPNGLQTLSRITISDLNDEMRLRRFSNLRHLRCRYGQNFFNCPKSIDLSSHSQLVSLHVHGWTSQDFTFAFPVNIKKLSISWMALTPEALLSIGTLPNLEILKMEWLPFTEMSWDMRDDLFMKVKFLKLHHVIFREWNTSEYNFPSLEKLLINFNYEMCPLPSELGYIPTLQMIEVSGCNETVRSYAMKIMEEQEAEGNEQLKVIIHRWLG